MIRPATCIIFILLLFVSACVHAQPGNGGQASVDVRVLHKNAFGGGTHDRPTATWITEPDQYRQTYQRLIRATVDQQNAQPLPGVDFKHERVLLITMGQQPTGGYRLDLGEPFAGVTSDTATIPLAWIEPPPGALLPQVITSPYILLSLAKDHYARVQVTDQTGRIRLRLKLPAR